MKKLLFFSAIAMLAAGALSAKTIDEVRIYLNPGHGGWGPNDNPQPTIPYPNLQTTGMPDTCGFYESNTNLWKVLKLGSTLEKMGVKKENIMYSRVKNGPYPYNTNDPDAGKYDRNLSEICTEVEYNNIDIFLSVHSNNGGTDDTNYATFYYRGVDGVDGDYVAGSRDMASTIWPIFYTNGIDVYSSYSPTNPNIRGDISYFYSSSTTTINGKDYTGYLRALKHGAQGFLSEGYFHSYQPARHRALNPDYCGQEGVRYARGLCAWLNGNPEKTGYIMGTVKDLNEKVQNILFNSSDPKDILLPINGAKVTLYKDGIEVSSYQVDNNYNGVFVFEGLEPGNYTIDATADGYKPMSSEYKAPISVKANETSYPTVYLENINYVPTPDDYPDEINNKAFGAESAYNFKSVYTDTEIAELKDKTIRRSILRNGKLYVLAIDANKNPYVYYIDATTHQVEKTLSTEGTEGTDLALADIQLTADGVLVGCALELCHLDGSQVADDQTRGELNIYKWDNEDDGTPAITAPQKWIVTKSSGNWYRALVGNTMVYKGTSKDGTIVLSAQNRYYVTTNPQFRTLIIYVTNGAYAGDVYNSNLSRILNANTIGDDYTFTLSPINEDYMVVSGSKSVPREVIMQNSAKYTDLAEGLINKPSAKISFFKYAGHAYMVTGDEVDGKPVTKLIDVTDGFDKAKLIKVTVVNTNGTKAILAAAGQTVVTKNDETGLVTAANIDLVTLNADGTATMLSTNNTQQPTTRAELAYDLDMTKDDKTYTLTFKSTGDAPKGEIILTRTNNASKQIVIPIESAIVKGENTVTIDAADLTNGRYYWAVKLYSETIKSAREILSLDKVAQSDIYYGGATIVKDPESAVYNSIVYSEAKSGFKVLSPDFATVKEDLFYDEYPSIESPSRIAESNGIIYASEWRNTHSGIWMFDAANPTELTQFYKGTRDDNTGAYVVDEKTIGGNCSSVSFTGEGANRKMYVFGQDYSVDTNGNKLVRYDIGDANSWSEAPSAQFDDISAYLTNTDNNVELLALDNGVFASQMQSTGKNTEATPAFLFMDNDGNIKFNSGRDMQELNGCGVGMAIYNDIFAISEYTQGIRVCNFYFDDNNVPHFTTLFSIPQVLGVSQQNQLAFDAAGNLYAFCSNNGLRVFSIPCQEPTAITKAKKSLILTSANYTGINTPEADATKQVSVYPNPATDIVTVEAGEEISSIAVYNLTGAMVAAPSHVQGNTATINVDNLAAGSYIVRVNNTPVQLIKK